MMKHKFDDTAQFSSILLMQIIPNFEGIPRQLAGNQNQYTGYSYKLVGEASPNQP